MQLPERFLSFLRQHAIDPSIYEECEPQQYIQYTRTEALSCSVFDRGLDVCGLEEVPGIAHLYRVPGGTRLPARGPSILPLDIWSALTVHLLDPRPGEHLLDLCCAPGAKLVLAARLGFASVTGVDVSERRLCITRSLVQRHRLPLVRLFREDGRTFAAPPETPVGQVSDLSRTALKPFYSSSAYRKQPCRRTGSLYDKVLVDAQCTHDGSIKHILKNIRNNWRDYSWQELDRLPELYALQLGLLCNGWRMLRKGGTLIYSTCSMCREQNEVIVARFMAAHGEEAEPLDFETPLVRSSQGLARIAPTRSSGSAFFIARFRKK